MDKARLEQQLESGRSIEAIARDVDRDPSTVAYWVNKHGSSPRARRSTPPAAASRVSSWSRWWPRACR
jgi:transposase-like protein